MSKCSPERLDTVLKLILGLDKGISSLDLACLKVWAVELDIADISNSKTMKGGLSKISMFEFSVRYFKGQLSSVEEIYGSLERIGWKLKSMSLLR